MENQTPTRGLAPAHPGAILSEVVLPDLKARGVSKTAFADRLGVGRQTLYDLLNEKAAVTPEMALRLGKLLGNAPAFWMNLQQAHDLAKAGESLALALARIAPIPAEAA